MIETITTRRELRTRYKAIKDMIEEERRNREVTLAHSPRLAKKLKECDDALANLALIGNALGIHLPADDDEPVAIQTELFRPELRRRY